MANTSITTPSTSVIELSDSQLSRPTTLDVSKPEPSNKPPALRPSLHNWRSGATNWCKRGGSVFQIIFNSGQALPLPGGRFSWPRIGRGGGAERLRNMYRSWPQTRHGHGHDLVQCRHTDAICPCPRTVRIRVLVHANNHVHKQSVFTDRQWSQLSMNAQRQRSRIVRSQAKVVNHPCPRIGHGRDLSAVADRQCIMRVAASSCPHGRQPISRFKFK